MNQSIIKIPGVLISSTRRAWNAHWRRVDMRRHKELPLTENQLHIAAWNQLGNASGVKDFLLTIVMAGILFLGFVFEKLAWRVKQ